MGKFLIDNSKVKCEHCGHSVSFRRPHYLICGWCGRKVYLTKKIKFVDKILSLIRKEKMKSE